MTAAVASQGSLRTLGVALALCMLAGCGDVRNAPPPAAAPTTVGTDLDDTIVTTKVKSALFADPDIRSFGLKVETRKGAVQLSGFTDTPVQIERAITAARGVAGVKSVENGIQLKDGKATVGSTVDDGIITGRVKSALLSDPGVKSFDIAVVTRRGEVQLSGFVDSASQIDQAMAIAHRVSGVTSVGNDMSIKK